MSKSKISPVGIANYPRLDEPDTEYDPNGVYHTKLILDTDLPDVAAFVEQIDAWHDESVAAAVKKLVEDGKAKTEAAARKKVKDGTKPYSYVEDEEGNETSEVKVNFKMKAKVTSKKNGKTYELQPTIFDGQNKKIPCPRIYSGSELRIAYTPVLWFTPQLGASVKLQLDAVKILKLVEGKGGNAGSYGFGDDDSDYVGSDDTPFDPDTSTGGGDGAGDDDGSGDF